MITVNTCWLLLTFYQESYCCKNNVEKVLLIIIKALVKDVFFFWELYVRV